MSKKILYIKWGGLGDSLQFSTLPEAFHKMGYETYISIDSEFRNQEIYDLVWGKNPYVKGKINEKANCGHKNSDGNLDWGLDNSNGFSVVRNWELKFGVVKSFDENQSKYPVIYYTPNKLDEYVGSLVVDLNQVYGVDYIQGEIEYHLKNVIKSTPYTKIFHLVPNGYYTKMSKQREQISLTIEGSTEIKTKNIFEYCDIINSCQEFTCLWSGSHSLASAIKSRYNKGLKLMCFLPTHIEGDVNKYGFIFDNVDYILKK